MSAKAKKQKPSRAALSRGLEWAAAEVVQRDRRIARLERDLAEVRRAIRQPGDSVPFVLSNDVVIESGTVDFRGTSVVDSLNDQFRLLSPIALKIGVRVLLGGEAYWFDGTVIACEPDGVRFSVLVQTAASGEQS